MLHFKIKKISSIDNQLSKFKPRKSRAELKHSNNTEKTIFAIVQFRVFEVKRKKLTVESFK